MIIESIKIINFLSHEDTEITFEQGINIITGKNGAGKTSILDAIKFALFAESRNNEKNNELIKKGKNYFEITLNFNVNGEHYEVYRHFGLKKAKNAERLASVKKNGVIVAETYEGVNVEITKILNVSREVFKNSVFVEQGQMDSLISGTPKERKTIFSDIIGLTSLSRSADRLREIIGAFREEMILLQNSSERLDQAKKDIEKFKEEKKTAFESMSRAKIESEKYYGELEELKAKQKERDRYITVIENIKANISKYLDEIKEREGQSVELSAKISEITSIEKRVTELQENPYYKKMDFINRYFLEKSGMDSAAKDMEKANKRLSEYSDYAGKLEKLSEYHKKYSDMHDKYTLNSEKIKESRKMHEEYLSASSNIQSMVDRLNKMKNYVDNYLKSSGLSLEDIQNFRPIREKINREISEKTSRISEIKSNVASYSKTLTEVRENMETLKGKSTCPLCGTNLTPDHMESISKEYDEKAGQIIGDIEKLKLEKNSVESDQEKLKDRYKIFGSQEIETAASYINEIKSLETEKKGLENTIENASKGHELFNGLSAENENLEKAIKELQQYENEYIRYSSIISGMDPGAIKREIEVAGESFTTSKNRINELLSQIGFVPEYNEYQNTGKISSEINSLKTEVERSREMKSKLESIKDEIENRKKSIEGLRIEMENKQSAMHQYDGIDEQVGDIESRYKSAYQENIKMKTLVDSYTERIEETEENAKNLEQDAEKYKKTREAISTLGKIREAFDYNGIQSIIRKDASASMTNLTRKYLQSFNLDFDDISIDENFDIKVTQNSMEQTLESLSGGEKTALAIAIRLSVTEYVLEIISIIIMDEPTNFLDEDRRNNLKDIILYSLKGENIVPQMIMITHHSELISVADASYEIIKTAGTSRVISS